jgi:hypothetical protein
VGAFFKNIFGFCGTGNKGCLGKEKIPKDDESTRNYGGMEQKTTKKTKLQSFNHPHKKAKRRKGSMSSSEESEDSEDSVSQ